MWHDAEGKSGLSEKLRGTDDGDKEGLPGEGFGTFNL